MAKNVMTSYRNFGGLEPSQAIAKFKQRKATDARTPTGATAFDDSGEEDQDLGEYTGGGDTADMSVQISGNGDGSRDTTVAMFDSLFPNELYPDVAVVPGAPDTQGIIHLHSNYPTRALRAALQ